LLYALVYPEAIRSILRAAIAENSDESEDDDRWPIVWQKFGRNLHPERQKAPKSSDGEEDISGWIEEVVRAFCQNHKLRTKYADALAALHGGSP
jgi:hypothetical protein